MTYFRNRFFDFSLPSTTTNQRSTGQNLKRHTREDAEVNINSDILEIMRIIEAEIFIIAHNLMPGRGFLNFANDENPVAPRKQTEKDALL